MDERQMSDAEETGRVRRIFAFFGIYILLLSQFLVFSKEVQETDFLPPYTWLAIAGVIVLIFSQMIPEAPFWKKVSRWWVFDEKVFWIFAGVLFSALAMMATSFFMVFARVNYIPVITVWLMGAICYVYAFRYSTPSIDFKAVTEWFRAHRYEILSVVLVTALAVAIRFYRLGEVPRVLDGDEGAVGLSAQNTVAGALTNPFALWDNFGSLYLQLINFSLRVFGINAFALRLLPAIGGALAAPSVYLLGRAIGGHRIGLVAAFLIATSHSHMHFSRIASVAYIHGTWLAPLELYLLYSGLEKRQSWRTALGGTLLAIHFSVYLTAQVVAALILVYMIIAFLFYRPWFKQRLVQAGVFWGGFLTMILPTAYYIFNNPGEFFNRLSKDGTFQSGWLEITMQSTGQSAVELLLGRVAHVFLSLIYFPARDFYGSPAPMLSMISSVMFLAGLGLALWRLRNPGYLLLNGYFWAATVSIGLFALPPSADSYRMLMAFPAAMIMASVGLEQILKMFGLEWNTRRVAYTFSVVAVLASLLVFNLWTYYADFAGRCKFAENIIGRYASYLGQQISETDSEQQVYMLSDGEYIHGTHPSTYFLSKSRPVINFPDPVDSLNPVSGEVIIAPPSRIEELAAWARAHPGGDLHYKYDCDDVILLSYIVP
ncbi:MAG: glycosyltransferase family 39 protein [Anaerolineales bacterium]|nr:glycosyltransferase family 39 protein [Anaerolineales bacterium]